METDLNFNERSPMLKQRQWDLSLSPCKHSVFPTVVRKLCYRMLLEKGLIFRQSFGMLPLTADETI